MALPRGLRRALARADAAMNRLYGWRYNPLYHSGALVVALLLVILATGVYLLLFYRIGAPFASGARIADQVWLGRWIRALHRYASDAAVVAAAVHALRILAQGRTWGPRALAWVTGLVLLFVIFLCGWTGYVMVWDVQGQALAQAGARLLDLLPIFSEPISRAFVGERPLPGAFFFLNLFAHIALPVGLGLLLWLHVSRLARPGLLPARRLGAARRSVPDAGPRTLRRLLRLLAAARAAAAGRHRVGAARGRRRGRRARAVVDAAARRGAAGALVGGRAYLHRMRAMRPRLPVRRHRLGPADARRPSRGQRAGGARCPDAVRELRDLRGLVRPDGGGPARAHGARSARGGAAVCERAAPRSPRYRRDRLRPGRARGRPPRRRPRRARVSRGVRREPPHVGGRVPAPRRRGGRAPGRVPAAGLLEPRGKQVAGAARLPRPRGGAARARGSPPGASRVRRERRARPTPPRRGGVPRRAGPARRRRRRDRLRRRARVRPERRGSAPVSPRTRRALGAITAAASLAFLAALSRVPYAAEPGADALLRLAWRARGERVEQCRRLTPAELARVPAHMRQEIQCTGRIVPYRLRVALDGREVINELVQAAGARHDRPLYVFRELRVPPGPPALAVRFARVRTVR